MAELGILLVSGDYAHAHAAFLMAAGATALGRCVTLFATGKGVRGLCTEWSLLEGAAGDTVMRARGVAGLDELREAVRELGGVLIACESGLAGEAIPATALMPGVSLGGMAQFLEATARAQLIAL